MMYQTEENTVFMEGRGRKVSKELMSDRKILEYAIVTARIESALEIAVNKKIQEGFTPFGPITTTEVRPGGTKYMQAVVKYAP